MKKPLLLLTSAITLSLSVQADENSFPELVSAPIKGAPVLKQPFLVMGSTKPVLTEKHGLAAPALWDWDGDGKRDLLVGEFETFSQQDRNDRENGSTIRVYKNVGTDADPKFTDDFEYARDTEGTIILVDQWCCIGFTPMFYDLNGDGLKDMITGQYHPGEVTMYANTGEGFKPGVKLEQEGDPASNVNTMFGTPEDFDGEPGDIETFDYWVYSSATFADIDDDGDYDLVTGGSSLRYSENIGGPNNPSFAERELLLDINGKPLQTAVIDMEQYKDTPFEPPKAGDGKTNPTAADWDNDGVIDLLVTDSYRNDKSNAVTFFRGVRTDDGLRFEPGIELLRAAKGKKELPGSGNRVYVDDWNLDGINDLIIGASVATVNGGEFSDELSWEWEDVTKVESAGKDPGLYPPREKPTKESMLKMFPQDLSDPETAKRFEENLKLNIDYWEESIGRLYKENKEHWLTMRHQGRVYVMLGEKLLGVSTAKTETVASSSSPKKASQQQIKKIKASVVPVTPTAIAKVSVKAGESFMVDYNFDMAPEWYIYAPTGRNTKEGMIETTIKYNLPIGISTDGNIEIPPFKPKGQFEIYDGKNVVWKQKFAVTDDLKAGTYLMQSNVRYQTCKNDICLPPETVKLETLVTIL